MREHYGTSGYVWQHYLHGLQWSVCGGHVQCGAAALSHDKSFVSECKILCYFPNSTQSTHIRTPAMKPCKGNGRNANNIFQMHSLLVGCFRGQRHQHTGSWEIGRISASNAKQMQNKFVAISLEFPLENKTNIWFSIGISSVIWDRISFSFIPIV